MLIKVYGPLDLMMLQSILLRLSGVEEVTSRMAGVRHKILVLSGKGGVGKSTFTAHLAHGLATNEDRQVKSLSSQSPFSLFFLSPFSYIARCFANWSKRKLARLGLIIRIISITARGGQFFALLPNSSTLYTRPMHTLFR